ncbi:hypothetical protein ACWCQW_25815 [Streptomyces mirabilis]
MRANRVPASSPDGPAVYADALHPMIWAINALSAVTAVAIGLLHRAKLKCCHGVLLEWLECVGAPAVDCGQSRRSRMP